MANDVSQNPWVLDTTGTIAAAGIPVVIEAIKSVDMTAADDSHLVADANDNQFWNHTASTAQESSAMDSFVGISRSKRTLNGLKVTISTGRLYIWVG